MDTSSVDTEDDRIVRPEGFRRPSLIAGGGTGDEAALSYARMVAAHAQDAMMANEAESERVDVVSGEADPEQVEQELRKQSEIVLSQLQGTVPPDAERREHYQEQWHELARQGEMEHGLCVSMARKSSRLAANPDLSQKWQRHQEAHSGFLTKYAGALQQQVEESFVKDCDATARAWGLQLCDFRRELEDVVAVC